MASWIIHREWRCISYWKWGFSNVLWMYREFICNHTWSIIRFVQRDWRFIIWVPHLFVILPLCLPMELQGFLGPLWSDINLTMQQKWETGLDWKFEMDGFPYKHMNLHGCVCVCVSKVGNPQKNPKHDHLRRKLTSGNLVPFLHTPISMDRPTSAPCWQFASRFHHAFKVSQ